MLHKLRYVAKGCQKAPDELLAFIGAMAQQSTQEALNEDPGHVEGFIAECAKHYWSYKNPDAICPSCRTDHLCWSEDSGEPRPAKPQPGDFRTDIRIDPNEIQNSDSEVPDLPWGPEDQPGF
ncbi:hypothetical protein [Glutamicibacter sp. AOP5-A2-18]|uniref:hypothetical protein n=1 Tax=Glutamicibacter sp. AOP5-A2-18 TaxID=3457656 RepID=UPI004033456D